MGSVVEARVAEAPRVAVGSAATAASQAATAEEGKRGGADCSHLRGPFLAATDSSLFGCNPVARH